jgi:hypothetical protein
MVNFPTSLDSLTNPVAGDALNSVTVPHATQHANLNDAVEALEAKVGIDGSAVATSLDYRVDALESAGGTDLSYTAATRVIASSTGTDATLPLVSTGDAGLAPASGGGTSNFLRADGTWTAPTGAGDVTTSGTQTLTNKRITKRVGSTTSSATPTINTDNYDVYRLTAQAADITSFTTNLSGTPVDGDLLWISITGTAARAITWGASFESSTATLPTTTVTTATLDVGFRWNAATSKWRCVATA